MAEPLSLLQQSYGYLYIHACPNLDWSHDHFINYENYDKRNSGVAYPISATDRQISSHSRKYTTTTVSSSCFAAGQCVLKFLTLDNRLISEMKQSINPCGILFMHSTTCTFQLQQLSNNYVTWLTVQSQIVLFVFIWCKQRENYDLVYKIFLDILYHIAIDNSVFKYNNNIFLKRFGPSQVNLISFISLDTHDRISLSMMRKENELQSMFIICWIA